MFLLRDLCQYYECFNMDHNRVLGYFLSSLPSKSTFLNGTKHHARRRSFRQRTRKYGEAKKQNKPKPSTASYYQSNFTPPDASRITNYAATASLSCFPLFWFCLSTPVETEFPFQIRSDTVTAHNFSSTGIKFALGCNALIKFEQRKTIILLD